MSFVVKTTTKFGLLDLIAPHSCRGCGELGAVVCECCKNNILERARRICPQCRNYLAENVYKCPNCEDGGVAEIFAATWREGWLGKLIGEYKIHAVRAAREPLVDILDHAVLRSLLVQSEQLFNHDCPINDNSIANADCLVSNGCSENEETRVRTGPQIVVVPLPTIRRHVRERGFDHTVEIAKSLARRHHWCYEKVLGRAKDSVQVGASKTERQTQAKSAYVAQRDPDPAARYLLIDDIWTTGASMRAAINVLHAAGVPREQIHAAVIAVGKAQN